MIGSMKGTKQRKKDEALGKWEHRKTGGNKNWRKWNVQEYEKRRNTNRTLLICRGNYLIYSYTWMWKLKQTESIAQLRDENEVHKEPKAVSQCYAWASKSYFYKLNMSEPPQREVGNIRMRDWCKRTDTRNTGNIRKKKWIQTECIRKRIEGMSPTTDWTNLGC